MVRSPHVERRSHSVRYTQRCSQNYCMSINAQKKSSIFAVQFLKIKKKIKSHEPSLCLKFFITKEVAFRQGQPVPDTTTGQIRDGGQVRTLLNWFMVDISAISAYTILVNVSLWCLWMEFSYLHYVCFK